MRRGTTSTIIYTLPDEVPVAEVAEARISLHQARKAVVDRPLSGMAIDAEANTLGITLTQEEALQLKSGVHADIQLKVKLIDGNVLATSVERLPVYVILNEEVL